MIKALVIVLQVMLATLVMVSAMTVLIATMILHTVSAPVCVITILALMVSAGIGFDGIWTLECYLSELSVDDCSDNDGPCWVMFQHGQVITDMHPTRLGAIWELILRVVSGNSKKKESAQYLAERNEI